MLFLRVFCFPLLSRHGDSDEVITSAYQEAKKNRESKAKEKLIVENEIKVGFSPLCVT